MQRFALDEDDTVADQRANLQDRGTATYRGTIALGFLDANYNEVRDVLGDAEVTADFGANTLAGTARNFNVVTYNSDDTAVIASHPGRGQLDITNGVIGTTPAGMAFFEAQITGQLSDDSTVATIDADLEGGFTGSGAVLVGVIDGRYDLGDGRPLPVEGALVTQR